MTQWGKTPTTKPDHLSLISKTTHTHTHTHTERERERERRREEKRREEKRRGEGGKTKTQIKQGKGLLRLHPP